MNANKKMQDLLTKCHTDPVALVDCLRKVLEQGLLRKDSCLLLRSLASLVAANAASRFSDRTGYECFVNHIHLEDYLNGDQCILLAQALAFGRELARVITQDHVAEPVLYIVAANDGEINVRFHILRAGESWLADNLEGYREAVAAFGVSELVPRQNQILRFAKIGSRAQRIYSMLLWRRAGHSRIRGFSDRSNTGE